MKTLARLPLILFIAALAVASARPMYLLGPDDQIVIHATDVEEFPKTPIRVDAEGFVSLPTVGRVEAGGKTINQLESELRERLKKYVIDPQVTVSIAEFRSRPVSIFGAVTRPGVVQLRGPKTLWEVITESGGFKNDAGETIRITRRLDQGEIPIDGARIDETGRYSVLEIDTRSVMEMTNPEENIPLMENDVIAVSQSDVVYVVGHVNRAGGFVTNGSISLLEALSLSGGFRPHANAKKAAVLRARPNTDKRQVIPVNLKQLLKGEAEDIALKPQDILFVPHDSWKDFGVGLARTAVAAATSAGIYAGVRY